MTIRTDDHSQKYIHHDEAHNLESPSIIVPIIVEVLQPNSVVDFGCGTGTFLSVFKNHGVTYIRGYDGDWVNREKLARHIDLKYFIPVDLEQGIAPDRRFDLAVCLEVAEHLSEKSADILINTLISFSDIVLFAAAIPGQMGQNHVNEQWPEYWQDKFLKVGYHFHDVFRPIFWRQEQVPRWYKQNMFLVLKEGYGQIAEKFKPFAYNGINSYVHPEYFSIRVKELEQLQKDKEALDLQFAELLQGKAPFNKYIKMLIKAFFNRFKQKQ